MQKSKKEIEPIPDEFKTIIEASDFWDTHDASDYWDKTKKAKFRVSLKKEPKYIILVYIEGAGGCAGVAEYCREAWASDEQLQKHLAEVKDALFKIRRGEKELKEGKTKVIKSLADLRS